MNEPYLNALRFFYLICLPVLLSMFTCTNTNYESLNNHDFVADKKQKLIFIDTVRLGDSKTELPAIYGAKIFNDTILSILDVNGMMLSLYSTRGEYLFTVNNDYVKGCTLPALSLASYTIDGDDLYLLYYHTNQIYHLKLSGEYKGMVQLNYAKAEGIGTGSNEVLFEWDSELDKYVVYSDYANWQSLQEKYKKSKIISVFDCQGKLESNFGEFPLEYTGGKLIFSKQANLVYQDGYVYVLHSLGEPKIIQYTLTGKLVGEFYFSPKYFDAQIRFYKNDPFTADPHDHFNSFTILKRKGEREFYLTYGYFEKNERSVAGHASYHTNLVKLNIDKKSIFEQEIAGPESIHGTHYLISNPNNDTLSFLIKSPDLQQAMLVRAIVE